MATYGSVWQRLVIEWPDVPPALLRKWTADAVEDLWRKYAWSFRQAVSVLAVADARDVTCTVTNGSTSVTSAGGFLAADRYRSFRVGTYPTYLVATFVGVNEITLDRAYEGETDADASGQILDAQIICPSDWGEWWLIVDVENQRVIPFWYSEEDLDRVDPARTFGDVARAIVATAPVPSSVSAYAGRARYEYWPRPTAEKSYPMIYLRRVPSFVDSDTLDGVWDTGVGVLEDYVGWRAARWPGPQSAPNGGFNLAVAKTFREDYEEGARSLYRDDRNRYPQGYSTALWHRLQPFAYSSENLRQTDVTAGEYFSGAFSGPGLG